MNQPAHHRTCTPARRVIERFCVALSLWLAVVPLAAPRDAAAQLIAHEAFGYPAGATLHGKAGGFGFGGTWFEGGSDLDVIDEQNLPYPNLPNAGRSLRSRAPTTFYSDLSRTLATSTAGTTGTTLWASFLLRKVSEGTSTPPDNYFGLVLYPSDSNASALFIGDTGETDWYSLAVAGSSEGQVAAAQPSVAATSATLLVVKISFLDGADTVELFVNPDPRSATPGVAAATKADLDIPDISAIGLLAGYDADWRVDEIRIGRRFSDVARSLAVTAVSRLPNGHIRLEGIGLPSETHRVEVSSDLVQPFTFLGNAAADADGTILYEDANAGATAKRFYRLAFP